MGHMPLQNYQTAGTGYGTPHLRDSVGMLLLQECAHCAEHRQSTQSLAPSSLQKSSSVSGRRLIGHLNAADRHTTVLPHCARPIYI